MNSTELGIVTSVKPSQPQNAPSPMEVTESGIVTEVKREQPQLNAYLPMEVTPFSITTVSIASRYEYQGTSELYIQSFIAPEPEIVNLPVVSRFQFTLSPQVPE